MTNTENFLLITAEILVAAVLLTLLGIHFSGSFSGETFEKKFLVEDFGLTIDTLSISPNEIDAKYNLKKNYLSEIKDSTLEIKSDIIGSSEKYNLISDIKDFKSNFQNITI